MARCPASGLDVVDVEVENTLGDAGTENRTGIVWPISLFNLTRVLGDKQGFDNGPRSDVGDVHDLLHAARALSLRDTARAV
jgi:hypothetical protein